MAQRLQGGAASESVLGGGKALRDDGRQVMVDHELLCVHHVGESLHAERLGRRRGDEQDVGLRRGRVCGLDVKRNLERPRALVLLPRALRGRRRSLGGRRALHVQLAEGRHAGGAGHALFAAHRLQAECLVVHMKIVCNRVAAVRVDDGDGHAFAVPPLGIQRPKVVRGRGRFRSEAPPAGADALRLCRRSRRRRHLVVLRDRRVKDRGH